MRQLLSKTWVKIGLAMMALPTALAEAQDSSEGLGHALAVGQLTASLETSALGVANPLQNTINALTISPTATA